MRAARHCRWWHPSGCWRSVSRLRPLGARRRCRGCRGNLPSWKRQARGQWCSITAAMWIHSGRIARAAIRACSASSNRVRRRTAWLWVTNRCNAGSSAALATTARQRSLKRWNQMHDLPSRGRAVGEGAFMETLAVMLGCGACSRWDDRAVSRWWFWCSRVTAVPVVAIVTGIMRAADVLGHRDGGWTPVHGLRRKAA